MFEMPGTSLLSLLTAPPAVGGAIPAVSPAGTRPDQPETGGFAQVLALLPTADAAVSATSDARSPVPTAEPESAIAATSLPDSGKTLPVAPPLAPPPTPLFSGPVSGPSTIPAGILAILPQTAERPIMPNPAASPPTPPAAIAKEKPGLPAASRGAASPSQPETPSVPDQPGNAALPRQAGAQLGLPSLARSLATAISRKSAQIPAKAPAKAAETSVRDEHPVQQPAAIGEMLAALPQQQAQAAETAVLAPIAQQVLTSASEPDEALPGSDIDARPAEISQPSMPPPRGLTHQQNRTDQPIISPSEPTRATVPPSGNPPKIELPIAGLVPLGTPPIVAVSQATEAETPLAAVLTVTVPLRSQLAPRGEAPAAGLPIGLPFGLPDTADHANARSRPAQSSLVEALRQPDDAAVPVAPLMPATPQPSPFIAPDVSAIAGNSTERPADFTQIVDRLIAARDGAGTAAPQPVHISLNHAEFGKITLRFSQDDAALSVAMSSADPGFARAVQTAANAPTLTTTADTGSNQPQSRGNDTAGSAPGGQPQTGSQGNQGTRQPAADFRPARNPTAPQSRDGENEPAPEPRHRFA